MALLADYTRNFYENNPDRLRTHLQNLCV